MLTQYTCISAPLVIDTGVLRQLHVNTVHLHQCSISNHVTECSTQSTFRLKVTWLHMPTAVQSRGITGYCLVYSIKDGGFLWVTMSVWTCSWPTDVYNFCTIFEMVVTGHYQQQHHTPSVI